MNINIFRNRSRSGKGHAGESAARRHRCPGGRRCRSCNGHPHSHSSADRGACRCGGGGTSTARTAEIGKRGAFNFLVHAGILDAAPIESPEASIKLDMQQPNAHVFSEHNGLLEPCISLGDAVQSGDLLARVYPTERSGAAPVEYRAASDGIILGRHFPSLVKIGDFMNVIASIVRE